MPVTQNGISSEPVLQSPAGQDNSAPAVSNVVRLQVQPISTTICNVGSARISKSVSQSEMKTVSSKSNAMAVSNIGNQNTPRKIINVINLKQNDVTDLSFKGENLQQLSTNALPPYTPGSPPTFVKNDATTFEMNCCTHCGDTFVLKSSLTFHLERRSVLIKFHCETCKCIRIFYNRCTLQSHIRSHADKGEPSDIGKAIVNPLPRVFMDGIQNEFVNNLDDELNAIDDTDLTPPTELLEFSLKEVDESDNVSVKDKPREENDVSVIKVKCLDCNEDFESIKDRKEHLTNGDRIPVVINSQCNKCGMLCPSKCSLKAHQRIHLQISPYVCPECGESPDPHWAAFLHHVNLQCFHNARSIGYKCPVCKRVSPSNESLLKHMELHTEKYAKCDTCPRAYMSTVAFESHCNLYHRGKTANYNMIYKCSLCDIVFLNSDQMLAHRSTHLKEQICEYVFNCMQCGKPVESKALLFEHIKDSHPKVFKHITLKESSESKPVAPPNVSYRGKVECLLCHCTFHSHQGYSVHISRAHININQPCTFCYMIMSTRKEMINHGKKHLKNRSLLCLLCNNKKCNDEKVLESHLIKHVERLKFCSFCPVCDKILPNLEEALEHLREEHFLPSKTESAVTSNYNASALGNVSCHFCRISFASESVLGDHLMTKHNINIPNQDSTSCAKDKTDEQPLKKQRIEGNTCAKCSFNSAVREDFKKHILSHKTNKSTFQCQECGLCFIVEPSLTRHLRVAHKISDTQKYIKEEGTNFQPDFENPSEVSARNALECSVCFTTFPNEKSLKTHMRSHGMAFIQAAKSLS